MCPPSRGQCPKSTVLSKRNEKCNQERGARLDVSSHAVNGYIYRQGLLDTGVNMSLPRTYIHTLGGPNRRESRQETQ